MKKNEKNDLKPVVKWVGGKRQLLPVLKEMAPSDFANYYEPFFGGGAFLWDMAPEKATVNDLNKQLVNVYKQIKENCDEVIDCLMELNSKQMSKDYYDDIRSKYNSHIQQNILDVKTASYFIVLNKYCFNGLYKTNKRGLFNTAWNHKEKVNIDLKNIKNISDYLNTSNVSICSGDFEKVCETAQKNDFIFFDSPYMDTFTNYQKDGFSYSDQIRLADLAKELDRRGCYVMLTNSNVEGIYELYKGFNIKVVPVKRSVNRDGNNRKGTEVIITNY